jgi:hypothetical protein
MKIFLVFLAFIGLLVVALIYPPMHQALNVFNSDVAPTQSFDAATSFLLTAMPYIAGGILFICAVWILRSG